MSLRTIVAVAAATCLLLLVAASLVWFFGWNHAVPDVAAYWRAAGALLHGGDVYAPPPPGPSPKAFLYPPAFAVLFAPLTLLPPLWGHAGWMALHFVFLGWLVWTSASLAQISSPSAWVRYVGLLLVWLPPAIGGDFQEGQVNLLVAALVATALVRFEEDRCWRGASLLGLAVHIKLLPVALLAPLFLQGRRRAVGASLACIAALALLPALVTVPRDGWSAGLAHVATLHADFARTVVGPALTNARVVGAEQFYVLNNSLVAVLHRLFGDGVAFSPFPDLASWHGPLLFALPRALLRATASVLGASLLAGALVLARSSATSRNGRALALGLSGLAVELATLNCWEHHLVVVALVLAPIAATDALPPRCSRALMFLSGAVFALWTGPYLLSPFALAVGVRWPEGLLTASRTWGFPTAAVVALGIVAVTTQRREESIQDEVA